MFSQSGTSTPVPTSSSSQNKNVIPIHDQINDSITWVYDWYSPNFNNNSFDNTKNNGYNIDINNGGESTQSDNLQNFNSLKLKGWFKTNYNHKLNTFKQNNNNSFIDLNLNKWKYLKDNSITPPLEEEDVTLKDQSSAPATGVDGVEQTEELKLKSDIPEANKQFESAI